MLEKIGIQSHVDSLSHFVIHNLSDEIKCRETLFFFLLSSERKKKREAIMAASRWANT